MFILYSKINITLKTGILEWINGEYQIIDILWRYNEWYKNTVQLYCNIMLPVMVQ